MSTLPIREQESNLNAVVKRMKDVFPEEKTTDTAMRLRKSSVICSRPFQLFLLPSVSFFAGTKHFPLFILIFS